QLESKRDRAGEQASLELLVEIVVRLLRQFFDRLACHSGFWLPVVASPTPRFSRVHEVVGVEGALACLREARHGRLALQRLKHPRGVGMASKKRLGLDGIALAGRRIRGKRFGGFEELFWCAREEGGQAADRNQVRDRAVWQIELRRHRDNL